MKNVKSLFLAVLGSVFLVSAPAFASKNAAHEKEKAREKAKVQSLRSEHREPSHRPPVVKFQFAERDRAVVREYYGMEVKHGRCPPGLAKKGGRCLPPGQVRKWSRGYVLPRDVIFHDVPHDLVVRLPSPPEGHRYVRVAGDVLLIAIGSGMVVDAIQGILQ